VIDAYFSGTKIRFILDAVSGAQERAERGELAFGTVDSWLLHKLTRGRVHATEYSNASRTLVYNIHERDWDDLLLGELRCPRFGTRAVSSASRIRSGSGPRSRLPASRATSRRRSSGRAAPPKVRRRTPTGRAASCS
jgi:glycerol kinase